MDQVGFLLLHSQSFLRKDFSFSHHNVVFVVSNEANTSMIFSAEPGLIYDFHLKYQQVV